MIMGRRMLENVKDFEMSKNEKWMSFLVYLSRLSVSFTGFELLYKSVSCRKLIVMQMIIVHQNVNKFCLVPYNWLLPCGSSPVFYLFVNSSQYSRLSAYACLFRILWTNFNFLPIRLLINELNKVFYKCSFYVYMTVMILTFFFSPEK